MEALQDARDKKRDPRVLIVEGNQEQANLMRHGLQFHELNFEVEFVSTLQSARQSIANTMPDIVITELVLSDGRAFELVPEDPETADYPVVIFTDQGSEKDAVELLKAGVLDYVVKNRRKCQEIGVLVKDSLKSWHRIRNIRQAEVNLQQTLRLARSIMDSLPNPVAVLDDSGQILLVNNAWKSRDVDPPFFGESVAANTNYIAYCKKTGDLTGLQISEEIQRVIKSQQSNLPIHYSTNSEVPAWFCVSIHPCHGSGRAKSIVIYQDITDRKILEVSQSERETAEQQLQRLTPRERQVMDLVVQGKPNKAVARSLNISVKTVEMHRSNMMKKLKLRNVTELVKLAVNAGTQKRAEGELVGVLGD